MALNFVKFQRGSQAAYDKLKQKHQIEEDALYFIYDQQAPENGGLLYLGETLIGGSNGTVGNIGLKDLLDVDMTTDPESGTIDGFILQYNDLSKKWKPASLKTAVEIAKPELISVLSGEQAETQTIEQALNSIDTTPNTGDIIFLNNVPYIYNGTQWEKLIGSSIEDRIETLENRLNEIENLIDTKIAQAIADTEHLTYKKVDSLPELPTDENAEKELKNIIFLIEKENPVDENIYDEYMFIDGAFEKIGALGTGNLDDYVTKSTFDTKVGEFQNQLNEISREVGTFSTQLTEFQSLADEKFVLKTDFNTFTTKVGNFNALLSATGKQQTTIIDAIIEIENQIQWQSISDEII